MKIDSRAVLPYSLPGEPGIGYGAPGKVLL